MSEMTELLEICRIQQEQLKTLETEFHFLQGVVGAIVRDPAIDRTLLESRYGELMAIFPAPKPRDILGLLPDSPRPSLHSVK